MAKNENRNYVTLACQECKHENYTTSKNKKNTPEKLETKKFCSNCGRRPYIGIRPNRYGGYCQVCGRRGCCSRKF